MENKQLTIGFISYEFPPETGGGGIGTYLQNCIQQLGQIGHKGIVICGTYKTEAHWETENVYRIPARSWEEFNSKVLEYFDMIRDEFGFDLIEGTDFKAGGLTIKKAHPELPFVVKLHTPLYLIDSIQFRALKGLHAIRFAIGSLLRFKWPSFPEVKKLKYAEEFEIIKLADAIHAPGHSIVKELEKFGMPIQSADERIAVFPLLNDLTAFSEVISTQENSHLVITFLGRKELRKGVLEFAEIAKKVLSDFPGIEIRFIGSSAQSPIDGLTMDEYLREFFGELTQVKIMPAVPYDHVPMVFRQSDIMVFPSHYESFGLVCAEAMASGKAVIGSKFGGMSEMINDGVDGLLVDPMNAVDFEEKLTMLISNDEFRKAIGEFARKRALSMFSAENTIGKQIENYTRLINEKSQRNV